ncbi:hypothetical protein Pint_05960 [Pistacia integerrima]|nr:hypothetical protein Pint_05960 [Pistacia integerrima]
MGKVLIH